MSLVYNGMTIVGPGNSPYIGNNGHWFCGHEDLGVDAGTDVHYIDSDNFKTSYHEGIYFVYDKTYNTVECWHIDAKGKKYLVSDKDIVVPIVGENGNWFLGGTDLGIPATGGGTGSGNKGSVIDDDSINGTTVWSSKKIQTVIDELKQNGIPGTGLDFHWNHTSLGVKRTTDSEFHYTELQGPTGPCGLDGSSIVGAELDKNGDLWVTMQDIDDPYPDTKILSIDKGFITAGDFKSLLNTISKLSRDIVNIKNSAYRLYRSYSDDTDGEFDLVKKFTGSGYCQILVTPFKGAIRVTVDGIVYKAIVSNPSTMGETSLVALDGTNKLVIQPMFSKNFTGSLDIRYNTHLIVEILVDPTSTRDSDSYPKVILQGNNYSNESNTPGDNPDDFIEVPVPMNMADIDDMMGLDGPGYGEDAPDAGVDYIFQGVMTPEEVDDMMGVV